MALGDALSIEIETRLGPRLAAVRRLQAAVDAWIVTERAVVTAHVARDVLSTLGQTAAAADATATAAQAAALAELRAAVEALAPAVPARPAPPPTKRAATIEEKKNCDRLIAEVERVDPLEDHGRIVPLLRMLTAEVRAAMDPLSPSDPTYVKLYESGLDRLTILHRQSGTRFGVVGLEFTAERQDWAELAQQARRSLDRIDRLATPTAPTLRAPLALVAGKKR